MNGFWLVSMDWDCAHALRSNQNNEYVQSRISHSCGINGKRIRIEQLSGSGNNESLQTLREIEEKEARSTRVTFYFFQTLWIVVGLLLGGILPLLVILRYLKTRNKSLIPYVVLVLIAQIGIFIYLANLSMSLYLDWASFNSAIIAPLFLIEIGLLIGAKLENRYHKTRFH